MLYDNGIEPSLPPFDFDSKSSNVERGKLIRPSPLSRPNFFIVGFPKCGTTTLYENLRQHPDIFMPWDPDNFWITKEPNFFDQDIQIDRQFSLKSNADYLALFQGVTDETCIGESSTFYIYSEEAPKRIYEMNPAAKIIIMLRNPIDMIVSWHFDCYRWGHENILDFKKALEAEADRKLGKRIPKRCYYPELLQYRSMGKYAKHIKRYLDVFGSDQVKIVLLHDLKNEPQKLFGELTRYLAVDSNFTPDRKNHNASIKLSRVHPFSLSFWERFGQMQSRLSWVPESAWNFAGKLFHKTFLLFGTVQKTSIQPELRAQLIDYYQEDIREVEALIGRDLSAWRL